MINKVQPTITCLFLPSNFYTIFLLINLILPNMFRSLITTCLVLPASSLLMESNVTEDAQLKSDSTMQLIDEGEWQPNTANCQECTKGFGVLTRRHHCRFCGLCMCNECAGIHKSLQYFDQSWKKTKGGEQRICTSCQVRHEKSVTPITIKCDAGEFGEVEIDDAQPNSTGKELKTMFSKKMFGTSNAGYTSRINLFFLNDEIEDDTPLSEHAIVEGAQVDVTYDEKLRDHLVIDRYIKAAAAGNESDMELYAGKGATPARALQLSARRGNLAAVETLIPLVDQHGKNQAFLDAVRRASLLYESLRCVKLLFESGIEENALEDALSTAVQYSAPIDIICFLFELGAKGSKIRPTVFHAYDLHQFDLYNLLSSKRVPNVKLFRVDDQYF